VSARAFAEELVRRLHPNDPVPCHLLAEVLAELPRPDSTPERDLTVKDLMKIFGRSRSTICSWANTGLLPGAFQHPDGSWRFPPISLESYRTSQRATPPSPKKGRGRAVVPADGRTGLTELVRAEESQHRRAAGSR
jgi:hypothetical protein